MINYLIFLLFIKTVKSVTLLTPQFQNNSQASCFLPNFTNYRADISTSTQASNISRESYDYFHSTVTVKESSFSNCFAFGSYCSGPNGGAIYCYYSTLLLESSNFTENVACDGGAICIIKCQALIKGKENKDQGEKRYEYENCFKSNTAYYSGGAILCEGFKHSTLNIIYYKFINNIAHQTGGAVQFEEASEINLYNLFFKNNRASHHGGAIYAFNTDLNLFNSIVTDNSAGEFQYNITNEKMPKNTALRFRGRGCGGIAFIAQDTCVLFTQNNCFAYNRMINGYITAIGLNNSVEAGNDIMFEDQAQWHSVQDYFPNYTDIVPWLFLGKRDSYNDIIIYQRNYSENYTPNCGSGGDKNEFNISIKNDNFAIPSNNNSNGTSSIATPTKYTYAATPITRLPENTTITDRKTPNEYLWKSISASFSNINLSSKVSIPEPTLVPFLPEIQFSPAKLQQYTPNSKYTLSRTSIVIKTLTSIVTQSFYKSNFENIPTFTNYSTVTTINVEVDTLAIRDDVETTLQKTKTVSFVNTSTVTYSLTYFQTDTLINSTITKAAVETFTLVASKTYASKRIQVITFVLSSVYTEILVVVPQEEPTKSLSPTMKIALSCGIIFVVFCMCFLGIFLYRKIHEESNSGSSVNDDDIFTNETKINTTVIELNTDDDSKMLSTFNGADDIMHVSDNTDEDEAFLNGEF